MPQPFHDLFVPTHQHDGATASIGQRRLASEEARPGRVVDRGDSDEQLGRERLCCGRVADQVKTAARPRQSPKRRQRDDEIAERATADDGDVGDCRPARRARVVLDCLEEPFLQSRFAGL